MEERLAALNLLGALASAVGPAAPIAWGKEWTSAALESCSSEFSIVRTAAYEVRVPLVWVPKPRPSCLGQRSRLCGSRIISFRFVKGGAGAGASGLPNGSCVRSRAARESDDSRLGARCFLLVEQRGPTSSFDGICCSRTHAARCCPDRSRPGETTKGRCASRGM